jgi:Domain of unknown function (DUF4386)
MTTYQVDQGGRGTRVFGAIAVLSGVLFVAHLAVVGALPSPSSYHEVEAYKAHHTVYVLLFLSLVVFAAFAVVFLAGLPRLLGPGAALITAGATYVLAAGVLVTTLGVVLSTGALDAIKQLPASPAYASSAAFEGAFWANMQGFTNLFGDALLAMGFLLLGWAAWGTGLVPRWLAVTAFVGGFGALIGIVADPASGIAYIALAVWGIATGAKLLRRSADSAARP